MLFNFWKFQFQLFHRNLVKKVSFWSNTKLRQSESWTHDKLISCVKLLLQHGLQLIFNQSCTLGYFHRYWLESMWAPSFHRSVSFQPLEKRKEDMLKSRRGHNCEQLPLWDERLCCFIFSTFPKEKRKVDIIVRWVFSFLYLFPPPLWDECLWQMMRCHWGFRIPESGDHQREIFPYPSFCELL